MTVASDTSKVIYDGNGSATSFTVPFLFFQNDDLHVFHYDSNDVETRLLEGTDYSVTGSGNISGGEVIYPLSGGPMPAGDKLAIKRVVDFKQETDLRNQGGYYPEVVEDQFDRVVMMTQDLKEQVGRAIKVGVASTTDPSEALQGVYDARSDAVNSAAAALGSENKASEWAENPEDNAVEPGKYSALHHASKASASAQSASNSASNASQSASAASTSEGNASDSASAAQTSEDKAEKWAESPEDTQVEPGKYSALHHASKAASSASAAQNSASAASTSESNALGSENSARDHLKTFTGVWYGARTSDPTVDPNGDPPSEGDAYWLSTANQIRVFNGSNWDYFLASLGTAGMRDVGVGERDVVEITDNGLIPKNTKTLDDTDNLNHFTTIGWAGYFRHNNTNIPANAPIQAAGNLEVTAGLLTDFVKMVWRARDSHRVFTRYYGLNGWSAWTEMISSDNLKQDTGQAVDFPMSQRAVTDQLIGVGQTWTDVSASRNTGVNYTNNTGRTMIVSLAGSGDGTQDGVGEIRIDIDGVTLRVSRDANSQGGVFPSGLAVVPPGSTYKVYSQEASMSVRVWLELR